MRSVRRLSRPLAILTGLWAAVILALTLTPAAEMPRTPEWDLLSFDTAAHAAVFFVLVTLAWLAQQPAARTALAGIQLLISSIVFGGVIEILQHAMHLGRHGDWTDLLSDAIGAVLALLLLAAWQRTFADRLTALGGLLLLASGAATAQSLPPPAIPNGPDLARARRTIAALAAPGMHGRGYVRQGEHKAAAYLRGRLRQLGLQPLAPDFTQPFSLDVNTFPGRLRLKISYPILAEHGLELTRPISLQAGSDFIVSASSPGFTARSLRGVRLDSIDVHNSVYQDYWFRQVHDCVANDRAILLTAKLQAQWAQLPVAMQEAIDASAAKIILVPKLTATVSNQQTRQVELHVLDQSRYFGVGGDPHTLQLEVQSQLLRNYPTQNLAAVLPGTAQPDSFLVISAHYDHLGMMGKTVYFPGANDNASGVALLLELAAHYARPENRPRYSIAFLLFGAEEAGLVGSRYFVQHPLLPLARIKFLLNLDLLGTGETGATVVNGRIHEAAYQRLLALNNAHHYLPSLAARGRAANSDHFPFSEAGVPAFFVYTRGGSPAYHDVQDRPEALSLAGFAGAFGLLRDFLNQQEK